MKTNKKILTIFTLCIALLLTACSTTDTADTKENNASLTESDTDLRQLRHCTERFVSAGEPAFCRS